MNGSLSVSCNYQCDGCEEYNITQRFLQILNYCLKDKILGESKQVFSDFLLDLYTLSFSQCFR